MVYQRLLPDFWLANGDGVERSFQAYLADFNILAIRRVPVPSHGPPTRLLRRLLAHNRGDKNVTVRGFDIRSPDRPCGACRGPHIVFTGPDLATICDSDGSILRKFAVVGYDRFFVVRSVPQVIDAGSIEEISPLCMTLNLNGTSAQHRTARAPPHPGPCPAASGGKIRTCRTSA